MRKCFETVIAGFPIVLEVENLQLGSLEFQVTYGLQVHKGLSYSKAAHELGRCILHALACEGKLDE